MTSVNMPRDDAALHTNTAAASRTVNETQPYPVVQPVKAHEEAPSTAPQRLRRNQRQRRQHERRQRNVPVLLDTRSGRERRTAITPQADNPHDEPKPTGIDVYI